MLAISPQFLEQRAIDVKGYYKMYKTMYENPAELSRLTKVLEPWQNLVI